MVAANEHDFGLVGVLADIFRDLERPDLPLIAPD